MLPGTTWPEDMQYSTDPKRSPPPDEAVGCIERLGWNTSKLRAAERRWHAGSNHSVGPTSDLFGDGRSFACQDVEVDGGQDAACRRAIRCVIWGCLRGAPILGGLSLI